MYAKYTRRFGRDSFGFEPRVEDKNSEGICVGVQESFDRNDKPEYSLFHSIKRNKK